MSKEARKLQKAFLIKEETEGFLANLEKLKTEDSVSKEQYESMKGDYDQRLTAATSEITALKVQFSRQLEEAKRDLDANKWELGKLETRFKVGELSLENYQSLDRKTRRKIEKMEGRIAELDRLIKAESFTDIAGYAAIPSQKAGRISVPEGAAFTEFITSGEEITTPRTKVLGLVGGLLLIISVFLKWIALGEFFGMSVSFSGSDLSGGIAAAGMICGLICIGAAFLAQPKARGIVYIGAGTLAIIVFLVTWFSGPSPSELGGLGEAMEEAIKEMIIIREGVYFYIISAIAVIIAGIVDFRRE